MNTRKKAADRFTAKYIAFLLIGGMVLAAAVSAAVTWHAAKKGTADKKSRSTDPILILYTNDMHCAVEAGEHSLGFAGLTAIKDWAETVSEYVTLADCGDAIQGDAAGLLSEGACMVDLMNEAGYDLCTFGNHEFDYGMEQILALSKERSKARYLSCNFLEAETGKTVAEPYAILDYGGIRAAFIGISTPEAITSSSPAGFLDEEGNYKYEFCQGKQGERLYDAVQSAADKARQEGADYVIALAHLGTDESAQPYRSVDVIAHTSGIDALLDGHSHSVIGQELVKNKEGREVLLSSTGSRLANVGCLTIDTKGTAQLSDDTLKTTLLSGEAARQMDASVQSILAQYEDQLQEVVAYADTELSVNSKNGNRMVRCRETAIGNLCADAFRAVSGADLAVVNGGGIRAGISAGEVTQQDILHVFPFGNQLCMAACTGQEILDLLEFACRNVAAEPENADGPVGEAGGFLQVSGIRFCVDTGVESSCVQDEQGMFVEVAGKRRVKEVQILDQQAGEYQELDPEQTYTLAASDYLLREGGDGVGMFRGHEFLNMQPVQDGQALAEYLRVELGGKIPESYAGVQGRIIVR